MEVKNLKKNNLFNTKVKTKALTVLLVTFLLSAFVGTLFVGEASAIAYTQYEGTLNGADWALRIPDPWNGMLVIACRGYSATSAGNPTSMFTFGASSMLDSGFAVAASNYGGAGYNVKQGMSSSYELTMHIIENYDVTGKVFLFGLSMGGEIVLMLGEKYPDVYSGVLELYGVKDLKAQYNQKKQWATLTNEELEAELTKIGSPSPPFLFSSLEGFRDWCAAGVLNIELETGGTPTTNPQAYEDISPTYNADIQIPVITVHGTADALVQYATSLIYQNAVAKAGRSSLYRLYTVPGGQHVSSDVQAEIPGRFNELVAWSNDLTGAADWPMYRNNVQHSGYSTSNAPTTNQTLWIAEFDNYLQGSPAVVDGKLYVGAYNEVVCLDAANGDLLWNYTAGFIFSTPAVVNGKVYVGSYDDVFYCLDAATGTKIWSYTTGGDILPSPAVADGKVYVGSDDGYLYCFMADHGQVVWKFTAGGAVQSSPAVAYGKVYVGAADNKFYCIDAASGAMVWSYTTGDAIPATAAVVGGRVFIGSTDDTVYCLDAATGARIWSFPTGDDAHNPAVVDGKVYVGSSDNNMYCLDAETGALIWNFTAGGDVVSPAAVADGKVYTGAFSPDGNIYCLDAETGAKIWSYKTGSAIMFYSAPAIANGVVYFACFDHNVYAFSAWEPIPEGLTIGIMLLLSTIAVVVSARYLRKRREWENW